MMEIENELENLQAIAQQSTGVPNVVELTPSAIVEFLDRHIVGQQAAKRAVAVAVRNRWRRSQLPIEMRKEVVPKNILMIGPTGVGKTEIARRLAAIMQAPFIKVEATKYTEVGYVGRDVDSIVRDITEVAVRLLRAEKMEQLKPKLDEQALERILDIMQPRPSIRYRANNTPEDEEFNQEQEKQCAQIERIRKRLREQLVKGELDDKMIELDLPEGGNKVMQIFSNSGMEEMGLDLQNILDNVGPKKTKKRKVTVSDAKRILAQLELDSLIDQDRIVQEAIERIEQHGIVFIDEVDKIALPRGNSSGPDVSREGVQRDILPLVEGTTVITKYGPVRTDYILFIAAGAFNVSKPSDLIPEFQGRFPVRVELEELNQADLTRILTEPDAALTKQYQGLLHADNVELIWGKDGIEEIAFYAAKVNETVENIGARRLHTVLEHLLEEISYNAPADDKVRVLINREFVHSRLAKLVNEKELAEYIL